MPPARAQLFTGEEEAPTPRRPGRCRAVSRLSSPGQTLAPRRPAACLLLTQIGSGSPNLPAAPQPLNPSLPQAMCLFRIR